MSQITNYLTLIRLISNNEHLLDMANTLLQVYRHEAGKKEIVEAPLSVYDLAYDVVRSLKPLADEKGIDLNLETQPQSQHKSEKDKKYNDKWVKY